MTDREIVSCILRGHELYWDMLGKMRGNENHKGDVCWISGNIHYSYSLQLNRTDYNGQIETIIQRIKNGELPKNLTILPYSASDDIDLLDAFLKTNLFKVDYTSLGMAKILQPDIALPGADQRLSIHRVNDLNQLKMSGAIFNAAFEYDLFSYEHYLDAFNMGGVNFFLAEFAGLPIGACMTISDDELMEVAWVAVLTGYRKRGIAGRLVNKAEQYAIKNGKSISVLSAFEGGINAYKRVGYKAYCKIDVISYINAL